MNSLDRRFLAAMAAYVVLFCLGFFTLTGNIRLATLLVLGLFAIKTVLAELKRRLD